ncbi:MAG: hypothetical protein K0V04_40210, partial [Deltaproteobacteria bacterium]|nr:hypothetical protein [Deltaproteobacteria bacterium]
GDGTPELVATDAGVGGGLYIVDLQTGALRGGWTALEERSGIDAAELSVADVDDDGLDELIVPASLFGLAQLWVLDFGAGLDAPQVQTLSFDGYANVTPARVGRFVPGGELAIVVDQGPEQRTFVRCDGGSWCPATAFAGVHPSFAFGRTHIVDLDGDGLDEILNVASNPSFSRAVSVLDVADGLATAQTSSLLKWAWRHDAAVPTTLLQTPAQVPVDLDDDGQLEVVVSVVNDLGVEVDAAGAPANDGVDRPGAISTLVLDGSTGAVEQVIDDVFAYGWADLDGNGRAELIVSPTVGWHHESSLRGLELSCGAGCAMTRWQVDDARVHRYLDELDGTGLPDAALRQVLVGGQDPAIVVHRGQEQLGLLRGAQGSVAMVEALAVTPDAVVHGGDADWVVVADRDTVQLLDASLTPVAAPVQMPRRGAGQWLAAPLVDGGRMALSFEGRLLLDDEVSLLSRVALIADFGNDGGAEVVHFRNPHDGLGPGFEIRVDRVQPDGAGGLQPVWSRRSHEDPQLDGYVVGGALHFQLGDFDGQGVRDLVLPARRGSEWNYLVFDGDTGALDAVLQPGGTPSTYSPALVGDLVLDVPVDDVLMHGTSVLALLTIEALGPVQTVVPDFYQSVGLNADLDGDGQPEVVGTLSATIDNQMEARRSTGALDLVWGPRALGRPSGNANVLAVGDLDAAPGLDPVYVDGDGGVTIYSGTTGAVVEGFPVYMHAGGLSATPATDAAVASGVIVLDVDGDGAEEVVAGTAEGRVYAINAAFDDPQRGQLEWTMEIGAAVVQLAAADVDADGALEILVANDRGEGLVLDDLGVTIAIDPVTGCVGPGPHQVQGDAAGVARV